FVIHSGVITLRLGTVAAILRTTSGLDRAQRRELDSRRRVMRAVRLLRPEHELGKRQIEQCLHFRDGVARTGDVGKRWTANRRSRARLVHAFSGWHSMHSRR